MNMATAQGLERRDGLRRLLENSFVYEGFQRSVGKQKLRQAFIDRYARPTAGERLLDFGCGPGDLVPFVPGITFVGHDISSAYIATAKRRFGDQATFYERLEDLQSSEAPFDVVVSIGVLHHIDDDTCRQILPGIASLLADGGRFVVAEPHLHDEQHWIARELIKRDRGRFVRLEKEYEDLLAEAFPMIASTRDETMLRVPYTLTMFECSL